MTRYQEAGTGRTYRLVKRYEASGTFIDRTNGHSYNLYKIFS